MYHNEERAVACIDKLETELQKLVEENLTLRTEVERLWEERRWIPVEERLPPSLTTVLCSHAGYGSCFTGYCVGSRWIAWPPGSVADVAHWMPLPNTPFTTQ